MTRSIERFSRFLEVAGLTHGEQINFTSVGSDAGVPPSTIREHYQILEDNRPLPKPRDQVLVRTRLDGTLHVLFRDKPLGYRRLGASELRRRLKTPPCQEPPAQPVRTPTPRTKPAADHPWRRAALPRAARGKGLP